VAPLVAVVVPALVAIDARSQRSPATELLLTLDYSSSPYTLGLCACRAFAKGKGISLLHDFRGFLSAQDLVRACCIFFPHYAAALSAMLESCRI
jgi:hypothetical protein